MNHKQKRSNIRKSTKPIDFNNSQIDPEFYKLLKEVTRKYSKALKILAKS